MKQAPTPPASPPSPSFPEAGGNLQTTTPPTPAAPTENGQLPQETEPGADLNARQRLFCEHWAVSGDRTGSYRKAYPTCKESTALSEGARLAGDGRVLRYMAHLRQAGFSMASTGLADLIKSLNRFANFDFATIVDEDGQLLPKNQWPKEAGLVIETIAHGKFGTEAKIPSRMDAIKMLATLSGEMQALRKPNPPKATFVFNFGAKQKRAPQPKVIHGEVIEHEQDAVAAIGPPPLNLVDAKRAERPISGGQS